MTTREQELLARVEGILAETRRAAERVARTDAVRDELRAEAARRGELGPDWQAVQRSVDAGRTTLGAVFGGEDASPAARRLREAARTRLETMELPEDLTEQIDELREELP